MGVLRSELKEAEDHKYHDSRSKGKPRCAMDTAPLLTPCILWDVREPGVGFLVDHDGSAADKSVHLIVKPGDALPGGSTWQGVEPSRRTVGLTSHGQAFMIGVRADSADGIYMWQGGQLQALILGGTTVTGLGMVDGVSKGVGGVTGYHFGVSDDGHVAFAAVADGVEGYVLASPPAPPAGN
jgi:hypothetical protein